MGIGGEGWEWEGEGWGGVGRRKWWEGEGVGVLLFVMKRGNTTVLKGTFVLKLNTFCSLA